MAIVRPLMFSRLVNFTAVGIELSRHTAGPHRSVSESQSPRGTFFSTVFDLSSSVDANHALAMLMPGPQHLSVGLQ